MRPALVFTLAFLAIIPAAIADPAKVKELPHTEQVAKQLKIQRVFFPDASIEEWVAILSQRSRDVDPKSQGLNIRIPSEELADRTIHELKLRMVTLHYAVTAIAEHSGTAVEFGEESIVFRPADPKAAAIPPAAFAETLEVKDAQTGEVIVSIDPDAATPIKIGGREVIIARKEISYLERKARDITIPVLDFGDSALLEVCDFLRSRCRELDHEIDPNRKGINVRIPTEELAEKTIHELKLRNVTLHHAVTATAEAIGATVEFSSECIVFNLADPKAPVVPAKPGKNAATAIKARMIILPVLDFEETQLSEALDFFRARSRELDSELDPDRKGVNIRVVDAPLAEKEIHELKLHNVSLHHALTAIARMTGTAVEFGDESIVFRPAPRVDRQDDSLPLLPAL